MDFFYREKSWYAGQFIRKIVPKFKLTKKSILFFSTLLNKQKQKLLSVLVRDVDKTFCNITVNLPINENGKIDFDFMESFIAELTAYLTVSGLDNYELTNEEQKVLEDFKNNKIEYSEFTYKYIFNNIQQGQRLKKSDQLSGNIPFVMAGVTNNGVANYVSNPVASFPKNSITIDIFGNAFYRNYDFGAGDDTGVYWNNEIRYTEKVMLFFTTAMEKSIKGKYSYGKKLRSSQSLNFKMQLPTKNNQPDYKVMDTFISAIQKLVIKDVVLYADRQIAATEKAIK